MALDYAIHQVCGEGDRQGGRSVGVYSLRVRVEVERCFLFAARVLAAVARVDRERAATLRVQF